MKTFHCSGCGSLAFFENIKCINCGHALGFIPLLGELHALEVNGDGTWKVNGAGHADQSYELCENGRQHQICNWMVPAGDPNRFCESCRLNELIPNLALPGNLERWHKLELAKRRIIYSIMRFGLPTAGLPEENRPALRFSFIGDLGDGTVPLTGHLNGLITVNIAESDDVERERRRVNLHEPYRTLLGHLRHEVAHYYWDRLIDRSQWLAGFRKLFGDETADYAAALKLFYERGAPADWQARHVSAYASAHPWEDWAETWAHYFHIMDMVETAANFGMTLNPDHPASRLMKANLRHNFDFREFDAVLENWFPLTCALNSLNRGMGLPDVYPFALSSKAVEKLKFIHEVVQSARPKMEEPAAQPTPRPMPRKMQGKLTMAEQELVLPAGKRKMAEFLLLDRH